MFSFDTLHEISIYHHIFFALDDPWNRPNYIETKMTALACYQSQLITGRNNTFPTLLDDVKDRNRYWGWAIGKAYGEPFLTREEVGLKSLGNLA